ncbi:hypothetical protein [Flavobacterium sp. 3HN19-14]|uniref:hypothetical protein n=1 Tax=Flavobacterium sp. 3HN19-14 TaxID=3448133 RepID=UPI003EE23135
MVICQRRQPRLSSRRFDGQLSQGSCNVYGYEYDAVAGNKGYCSMGVFDNSLENIVSRLATPLVANTPYVLTFDTSLGDFAGNRVAPIQAYLSTSLKIKADYGHISITNPAMLFSSSPISTRDGWETVTITIPARPVAGEEYLYLGLLTLPAQSSIGMAPAEPNCSTTPTASSTMGVYLLDNVKLVPTIGTLNLPDNSCGNTNITNLDTYLQNAPGGGTYSGEGIVYNNGVPFFSAAAFRRDR